MKAQLIYKERRLVGTNSDAFIELVVWRLPTRTKGSAHDYKYRLALVINNECVMRYDNEAGKGDHRHISGREEAYSFTTPDALILDFLADVERLTK